MRSVSFISAAGRLLYRKLTHLFFFWHVGFFLNHGLNLVEE